MGLVHVVGTVCRDIYVNASDLYHIYRAILDGLKNVIWHILVNIVDDKMEYK